MKELAKHAALISLGCAKNLVDSEVMLGYLQRSGYIIETDLSRADVIIINTCGFIQPAREEAEEHLRAAVRIKRSSPKTKIVAAGCYVQKDGDELKRRFPQIDYWTGVNDFHHIVQLIEGQTFSAEDKCFLYDHESPRLLSTPSSWAYVKISEGCSHRCSFCTIPRIKGPYRSRHLESIALEAERLADTGVKEINLISQDSTYYGRDLRMRDGLARLVERLSDTPKLEWIRVLYSYPEEISDGLLEVMQAEKVCAYIDSPFQHADPTLIRRMKRGLDGPHALKLIEKIRKRLPEAALRTSLIVGFPGEGRSEFARLKEFVRAARFDHLGVFTYSHERAAPSSDLIDDIPNQQKNDRRQEIMEIQAEISAQKMKRWVGARLPVLLEGSLPENSGVYVGRTQSQAPEVDGVVLVHVPPRVEIEQAVNQVEIQRSDVYDLSGILI
jgi:ribosomal protein S12 methylthiotransferase